MTQIAELFESYETLSLQYNFEGKTMRLFGVELNQSPEEQNLPSSPEQRANKDFTRPQGESSTSRGKQGSIGDLTRHFATNPYYHHQTQGEASRQQDTASSAFRLWQAVRSPEAERPPEQSLLDEASCSQQQPQGDLHPHTRIDDIQRALQFGIDELERLRPPVPPHTERMAPPHPEERLLSNDEVATVSPSDSQGEPNHNSSHKRKRDEASSSRVPTTLGSTIYGGDLASQQQAQSDQTVHEQQNEKSPDQRLKEKAAKLGTTVGKLRYKQIKEKAAKLGTTAGKLRYKQIKEKAAKLGTTPGKIRYERRKARLAEQD